MKVAILEDDLVTATASGDGVVGVPIPSSLLSVPPENLRYKDGAIIDASGLTSFFIDMKGQKHVTSREDRQALSCALLDSLAYVDGVWRKKSDAEMRAPSLKAECRWRIDAVLSDATQRNLTAYAADLALKGFLSPAEQSDVATARSAREWVMQMLAACRSAIASGNEPEWPEVPFGVVALAERF